MNKKDFSNLEDEIMSTVSNAFKAVDIVNSKIDINNKTNNTINKFKSKFNRYSGKYMNINKKSNNSMSPYINKRPAGSISGMLFILLGSIGILVSFFSSLVFLVFQLLFNDVGIIGSYNVIYIFLFGLFMISVVFLVKGINIRKRLKRFKIYVRFINDNKYFLIKDLSRFSKEKESFIIKDLTKMIDLGMFLEGHIDEEKTYFMLSDKVYNDYLNYKEQQILKEINDKNLNREIQNFSKEEIESVIKIGRNYINQIKNIKNELYKEHIAIKLDRLINIANEIIDYVEKNPDKIKEVNKFINHYLPITIRLIDSYKEINNQLVEGNNIEIAKIEVENSIDLINKAFEILLNDLFEDVVLDISTDISVLKTLFKQEGLTEDDFKK